MQVVLGVLGLTLMIYGPGWCWRRWGYADMLTVHYERLLVSFLWSGWLALTCAELGIFSLPLHLGITVLFCVAGLWFGRRGQPLAPPEAPARPRWEFPAYGLILLIFMGLVSRPFEIILGGRDAGVYPNTGYAIARNGGITQFEPLIAQIARDRENPDPAISEPAKQAFSNFLGVQGNERFIATRFTQPGFFINEGEAVEGRVVPQFFHLYPVWIAIWTSLFGLHGGLFATGYLGLLALWSMAMAMRALLPDRRGAIAGILVLAFLAFNTLQVWFSRYSTSEICSQALLWAGLAAWANLNRLTPAERQSAHGVWYGLLAGIALGQMIFARIDFFWGIGPIALVLLWAIIRRRWSRVETALAAGLGAMLLQGIIHIAVIARAYFFDTAFSKMQDTSALVSRIAYYFYTPKLQQVWVTNVRAKDVYFDTTQLWLEIGLLGIGLGILVLLWYRQRWLDAVENLVIRFKRPLLIGVGGMVLLLLLFAYFIRPRILTFDAMLQPWEHRNLWESFIGAPLPLPPHGPNEQLQRIVVLGNLVRLGWYLSPLGIMLGAIGLAAWIMRGFNRCSWLILVILVVYGGQYIRDTYGTADQTYIYIARRFLPATMPAFIFGTAWLLSAALLQSRRMVRGFGWAGIIGLMAFFVATGWRSVRHVEYAGAIDSIGQFAERLEPNAIIIARGGDRDTPTNLATPLRYAFGREVLVSYSGAPQNYRQQLVQAIRHWQSEGRPVYFLLGARGGSLDFPGLALEDRGLFELRLPEWQQLQNQKPYTAGPIYFSYRLYKILPTSAPPTPAQYAIGLTDYRHQIDGFLPVEADRTGLHYAWMNGKAILALPPISATSTITLNLGLGMAVPPSLAQIPVELCPTLTALGSSDIYQLPCELISAREPQPINWELPPLPEIGERWYLHLPTRTWIPNAYADEYPTPPNDGRTLGILWTGGQLSRNQP